MIGLGAGEPDFDTPDFIKEAAIEAIRRGQTKYTAVDGTPELKAAIVGKFERENGLDLRRRRDQRRHRRQADHLQRLHGDARPRRRGRDPGTLLGLLSRHGACSPAARRCSSRCPEQTGFKLRPEDLDAAITPRTKWLILNSPNNPTGAAYDEAELRALTDVLLRHPHVWLISRRHLRAPGLRRLPVRRRRPRSSPA